MAREKKYLKIFGGSSPSRVVVYDINDSIKYRNPNYKPPECKKKSKEEQRAEKLSKYAEEHNISMQDIKRIISVYLDTFPEKRDSAGFENASNRFLNECLKHYESVKDSVSSDVEFSDDTLIFLLLLLTWGDNAKKIVAYANDFELWRVEVIESIVYYLSLYPEKILSEGCENLSERFFRTCLRNNPKIAEKMANRGIKV